MTITNASSEMQKSYVHIIKDYHLIDKNTLLKTQLGMLMKLQKKDQKRLELEIYFVKKSYHLKLYTNLFSLLF